MDAPFLFLVFAIIYSYFLTKYSSFTIAGVAAGHHFSNTDAVFLYERFPLRSDKNILCIFIRQIRESP